MQLILTVYNSGTVHHSFSQYTTSGTVHHSFSQYTTSGTVHHKRKQAES